MHNTLHCACVIRLWHPPKILLESSTMPPNPSTRPHLPRHHILPSLHRLLCIGAQVVVQGQGVDAPKTVVMSCSWPLSHLLVLIHGLLVLLLFLIIIFLSTLPCYQSSPHRHAPSLPCSHTTMLPHRHAISPPCSLTAMLPCRRTPHRKLSHPSHQTTAAG